MKLKLILLCSLGLAVGNAMACYTVYDKSERVVYSSQLPPVDMSLPLHETLPKAYPGGHMVFVTGLKCEREEMTPQTIASALVASPLLTDRRSAAEMKLPHVILDSGAALIKQRPANMKPGVVLTERPLELAANRQRSSVVITEMRDPPLVATQDGRALVINDKPPQR